LWNRAIDEGINYLDSAQNYNQSHARLRELLQTRRDEVVVVTKISSTVTLQAIENILSGLGIDYLDGLHLHNYGGRSWGDAMSVMRQAKQRGLIRSIGLSGHQNASAFVPAIETGDIDLVMVPLNFVDRNAYTFETTVRETAARFGTNVIAMKVWGGPSNWQGSRTLVEASFADHIDDALRYSLGIDDVVSAVIGIKNEDELLQAIEVARNFTPLGPDRLESLLETGRMLSQPRGQFYG
jgi:predicted aldo/keto reductase-like oxidoreductase